jgi:predicted protein tyrosine phosphatase
MPWIENVAAADIPTGFHHDVGPNSMLISICDPAGWRPEAKQPFKERHDFEFLDAEDEDREPEEFKITDAQAEQIVELLQRALENRMNVVVHCTAGICRSGAVVEVGVMMGFNDCEKYRQPNLRVKHKLMKQLGWTYN